jgi:hypothetical protein
LRITKQELSTINKIKYEAMNLNKPQKPQLNIGAVISRILLICLSIPFCWYAGQIISFGFITLLQRFGLDDNLFRFLDAVSLF